ncbi:MAG TPA: restriction endonuclease, partial [Rhodocyclaceae bacterium]|nr:restriction endonuclease [Rhodocyclaceae bacterium]
GEVGPGMGRIVISRRHCAKLCHAIRFSASARNGKMPPRFIECRVESGPAFDFYIAVPAVTDWRSPGPVQHASLCATSPMSRRKRTSPAEALFELAALLPWWMGLILAGLGYVVLHPIAVAVTEVNTAPGQVGAMMTGVVLKSLAGVGQYALPIIFVGAAGASYFGRRHRTMLVRTASGDASGNALRSLSWQDFERLVGEVFRLQGYTVSETGGGGADGGIDLELRKGQEVFLVQCKQWRAFKVSVNVVRELYGVMAARGAAGGFVVTSGVFTADARAFAETCNISLIEGPTLSRMIERVRDQRLEIGTGAPSSEGAARPVESPACPKCGGTMIRRTARQGANAGGAFWGCSQYPKCRGVRAID